MQDVLETTKTQINIFSQIKLKIFKILKPITTKLNKFQPFFTIESFIIYYFFLVFLFGRSFTGILIAGFRIGELMIGTGMLLFFFFLFFRSKSIDLIIGKKANYVLRIILAYFFVINFVNGGLSNFLKPEVWLSKGLYFQTCQQDHSLALILLLLKFCLLLSLCIAPFLFPD